LTGNRATTTEPREVLRFDRTERIVHWCNATLFLVLIATGAFLYIPQLSTLVPRLIVVRIHVLTGLALPFPLLIGLAARSGAALRRDARRVSRWIPDDYRWLRGRTRATARLGKFNPGQKANATFIAASMIVMLASGSIMYWFHPFSDDVRTGATFVHDWFAFGVGLVVIGHISIALADPVALGAMRHGAVPTGWAKRKRPRWYAEMTGDAALDVTAEVASAAPETGPSSTEATR
jgi:formate dehydrogenase subunit gamma